MQDIPGLEVDLSLPFLTRCGLGGVLMGLANLVPGISGGTMLLATGVYTRFIEAIAEISRFRFSRGPVLVLGVVVLAAVLAIFGLAGPVKMLVIEHRWVMYSLFIGLTLGGVPIVMRLLGSWTASAVVGVVVGLLGMVTLAIYQGAGDASAADGSGWLLMVLAGVSGAAAMILPGVSGAYLLLVLGVYVPILTAIAEFVSAGRSGDVSAMMQPFVGVVLPVGIGVILGVVVVSSVLRYLLRRFSKPTLGVLLGLLIGAVAGLWPFQQGVEPGVGDTLRGQTVIQTEEGLAYEETGRLVKPDHWATEWFRPGVGQVAGSLGLVLVGLSTTLLLGRLGAERPVRR